MFLDVYAQYLPFFLPVSLNFLDIMICFESNVRAKRSLNTMPEIYRSPQKNRNNCLSTYKLMQKACTIFVSVQLFEVQLKFLFMFCDVLEKLVKWHFAIFVLVMLHQLLEKSENPTHLKWRHLTLTDIFLNTFAKNKLGP